MKCRSSPAIDAQLRQCYNEVKEVVFIEFIIRPKPVSVKPLPDYHVYVEFEDGKRGVFDVRPYIKGSWYGKLADIDTFNQVRANGFTIAWPDGQDICPDCVYEETVMEN